MKKFTIDNIKVKDDEIRPLLDDFWAVNTPGVVKNVQAKRCHDGDDAFNIVIHHTGELVLPF